MMTNDNKIAFHQSLLERGAMSPEQQAAASVDFIDFVIEFRAMRRALDEIYQNEREQDEIDRRQAQLEQAVRAGAIAGVTPFPRRPVPVRLAMPPIYAVDGEVFR